MLRNTTKNIIIDFRTLSNEQAQTQVKAKIYQRRVYRMIKPIKLKKIEDIEKINAIVSQYPYDRWCSRNSELL